MNPANTFAPGLTNVDQLTQQDLSAIPQTGAPTAPAAAAPAAHQPNWFEKLLPTAGGVLGGILGTATDVVDGPLGSIGGAAGGSALGQALANKLEGKSAIQGNDLSSGIENGLGEATGLGVGKAVGALGEGLATAGAKAGDKAAQTALDQAATKGVVDDATATNLNYGGIGQKMQDSLGLGKSQQFVKSMGYDSTNPFDMGKVADSVSDLNNVYDHALTQSGPVDMKNSGDIFGATKADNSALSQAELAAMKKQGITPELSAKGEVTGGAPAGTPTGTYQGIDQSSPVGQALKEYNGTIGAAPNAKLSDQMDATEVRKLQQAVGRQYGNQQTIVNNAELNGTYNADAVAQSDKLGDIYSQLGDKIKTPEVDNAIKDFQVTDADRQGLVAKYGDKLGNNVADTIGNAKSADDLLSPMQDLTKMGRASRMAINDIENVTASPRAVARAKFQANGGVVPSKASTGATKGGGPGDLIEAGAKVVHAPAGAVISAGRKLHAAGMTPAIVKGVGNVMARTAPLAAPAGALASNIPNLADASQGGASAVPSNQGASMQPGAPAAAVNPLNSALSTILAQLQTPGASLTPGYGQMVSGVDALAPAGQQNALASNAVNALAPTYANAGGPSGLGSGLIDKVLAQVPGTAQNTYQSQQTGAADQVAKILGITPQAALAMFPQLAQTSGVAAPQQAATSGLVNTLTAGLPAQ